MPNRSGSIARPSILCGNIYDATKDANGYAGDLDYLDFQAGFGGSTTFTLTWEQTGDYDLYLFNGNNGSAIADSFTFGLAQPESFTATLSNGQPYILLIAGWDGSGGDWMVAVE